VDRSSAEGASVEAPKAPRGVGCGEVVPLPAGGSPRSQSATQLSTDLAS